MKFFSSDTHFADIDTLNVDMRPFKNVELWTIFLLQKLELKLNIS